MLLSETGGRIAFRLKDFVFRAGGLQSLVDEKEVRMWSHHMGFRTQWEEHQRFQFELARAQGLKPGDRFLEIGCGPLTLGIPLIRYLDKARYTGLDMRAEVLDVGLARLGKEGLALKNPRLMQSASFGAAELGPDERFDMVWSFSVLFHLTDALLDECFAQVARRLNHGGLYIANVNVEHEESTWLQFPFMRRPVSFYAGAARRHAMETTELGTLEALGLRLAAAELKNRVLRFTRH